MQMSVRFTNTAFVRSTVGIVLVFLAGYAIGRRSKASVTKAPGAAQRLEARGPFVVDTATPTAHDEVVRVSAHAKSCTPSVGVCGSNLNAAWGATSNILCSVHVSGVEGDVTEVGPFAGTCRGGFDSNTYCAAGTCKAKMTCKDGEWKTSWPLYLWTYAGWAGCGTPVVTTLGDAREQHSIAR